MVIEKNLFQRTNVRSIIIMVMGMEGIYMCIDLKSFYASVECVERKLEPLNTNLVVADESRTDKTVCLAVSPSLKQYGIGGRARLFEVKQKIKEVNYQRKKLNNYKKFIGKSYLDDELKNNRGLELDLIIAPPRMAYYMKYSTNIYNIYLKYIAPEDILVYSIDEVFIDITNYISLYKCTPRQLVTKIIKDVYDTTGITATAGIGTNMFLAKIAMDIVAKKSKANEFGVRIAGLDEMTFRKKLWDHKPITDFWRVGKGIADKLAKNNMFTMGDVARCSHYNEDLLYKLFGINAELLIDHAWGYEPCTIDIAKSYKPTTTSLSSGQVLHCPYDNKKARLIVREMADNLALDLVNKRLLTEQLVMTIDYDIENLTNPDIFDKYFGEITIDSYGRKIPKHSHGTINLNQLTSSSTTIMEGFVNLFDKISNPILLIRKLNLSVNKLISEDKIQNKKVVEQIDLFTNYEEQEKKKAQQKINDKNEKEIQKVMLQIKNKYGKNAILKGMNIIEGATAIERNHQIGGHHE